MNILFSAAISPKVIQVIPAIETESECIALQPQTTEQLSYCLWSSMEDWHLKTAEKKKKEQIITCPYHVTTWSVTPHQRCW